MADVYPPSFEDQQTERKAYQNEVEDESIECLDALTPSAPADVLERDKRADCHGCVALLYCLDNEIVNKHPFKFFVLSIGTDRFFPALRIVEHQESCADVEVKSEIKCAEVVHVVHRLKAHLAEQNTVRLCTVYSQYRVDVGLKVEVVKGCDSSNSIKECMCICRKLYVRQPKQQDNLLRVHQTPKLVQ